jgi:drug/metabolite transporter (DMT)-like permease
MTSPQTLSYKTSIMVALLVVFSSAGNLFFSIGMKRIGAMHGWSPAALHAAFLAVFTSAWIWLGIVSMLLFLAAMMLVLSWADFSYVLPASAFVYAITPLLGHYVLGETVTGLRWLGVALICAGVAFVSCTPHATVKKD